LRENNLDEELLMGRRMAVRNSSILSPGGSPFVLTYDATVAKSNRKAPTSQLLSEDFELAPANRKKLLSTTRDLLRNFTTAAWAIRRHLDYVTMFSFQSKTGDDLLDKDIEEFIEMTSKPERNDALGRFSLADMIRLAEQRRVVDGDVLLVWMADGSIQAIEGDRILTATNLPATLEKRREEIVQGVVTDNAGRVTGYIVARRSGKNARLEFERVVAAKNCKLFGYFDRFDQLRGVSPLAPAVNLFRDAYEGMDYALAKMKVSQLFALVAMRQNADPVGTASTTEPLEVDFGRGPVLLDFNQGDDAKFLESNSPGTSFDEYMKSVVACALKSLDIPYSAYDEAITNFSGQRSAQIQYERSADVKRGQIRDLLDHITARRIETGIASGELSRFNVKSLKWEWIPRGTPWVQPLQEVAADIAAISAGLTSRERVIRERLGADAHDVFKELAHEAEQLQDLGLSPAADGLGVFMDYARASTTGDTNE